MDNPHASEGGSRRTARVRRASLICSVLILAGFGAGPVTARQTDSQGQDQQQKTEVSNPAATGVSAPVPTEGNDSPGGIVQSPQQPKGNKEATSVNMFTGLGMVSADHYQALTRRQRWEYYVNQNFTSVGSYFGPVASSIIDQVNGQPPEWGGGMEGFGRRLASRYGTGVIQGTVQSAGAALLGQDPRYIRSANQGVFHRVGHAFVYSLITYNNSGQNRLALATLGSYYASSMLTNTWYPGRFTALGDGVRDGNRQVILAGLVNQFQEFWPEIRHYVLRRK